MGQAPITAENLRRELSALNSIRAQRLAHELTFGSVPSILYCEAADGEHGNFLPASYKRICTDPQWSRRLEKSYSASARVPRSHDRRRGELECANSSDALLMNIFCYPRVTHNAALCGLLGVDPGLRPEFGVRAHTAMRNGEIDRTELDMRLGPLLIEAKLTESGFGTASAHRVQRYVHLEDVFDIDELPRSADRILGYQLVRGVLAAHEADTKYVLLCDGRRTDLQEMWYRVLRAVRSCAVRSRMALLSWQELAACTPPKLRTFLRDKYGIHA